VLQTKVINQTYKRNYRNLELKYELRSSVTWCYVMLPTINRRDR